MTVDEAKALVKSRLSEKRYKHTINVKKMEVKLAKRYGADEEKLSLIHIYPHHYRAERRERKPAGSFAERNRTRERADPQRQR